MQLPKRLVLALAFGCVAFILLSVLTYRRLSVTTQPDADITDLLRDVEATTGLKTERIYVLGDPKSEDVISRLVRYMGDSDALRPLGSASKESWTAAMEALARIGTPAVPKLIGVIGDETRSSRSDEPELTDIQTRAAMVLGRIGDARALPVLKALRSDNSVMSFYVKEAIKNIEKSNDRDSSPNVNQVSSDDEVYEVYSTAIQNFFLKRGDETKDTDDPKARFVVINNQTVSYPAAVLEEPTERAEELGQRGVAVNTSTIEDFKRKCTESISLEARFTLPGNQVLISQQEFDQFFREKGSSWRTFYETYPKSTGYISLSRVGFNPNHNQAFLYAQVVCGNLCGRGFYVLLGKDGGVWSVRGTTGFWIA